MSDVPSNAPARAYSDRMLKVVVDHMYMQLLTVLCGVLQTALERQVRKLEMPLHARDVRTSQYAPQRPRDLIQVGLVTTAAAATLVMLYMS
jgi:hypothetical protein